MDHVEIHVRPEWEPFRKALEEHEIKLQRCSDCGYVRHPPRWICSMCLSEQYTWERLSGRGRVDTFVWYLTRLVPWKESLPEPPYNVAVVQLDEGPRLITNIVDVSFGQLAVGDVVNAAFDDTSSKETILRFTKASI